MAEEFVRDTVDSPSDPFSPRFGMPTPIQKNMIRAGTAHAVKRQRGCDEHIAFSMREDFK